MNQPLLISLMLFMVTLLVSVGAFSSIRSRQTAKNWGERIREKTPEVETTEAQKGVAYLSGAFFKLLERLGQATKPKDQAETSRLRKTLITAGYRGVAAPFMFLGSQLFCAVVVGLLFFIFGTDVGKSIPQNYVPLLIAGCAFGGFKAPQFWLSFAVTGRQEKLSDGFPDALDLIVVCVEAGLGLDQAIARVGEEIKTGHPALSEEFQIVSLELRAGFSRGEALRNLGERTDLGEIRSLIALLVQTDRFGTSVGQALRVHSDSMRTNRRLRAEELAAKLPVKLMLPLILFIFPALMVVLIGPGIIRVMRNLMPAMGSE